MCQYQSNADHEPKKRTLTRTAAQLLFRRRSRNIVKPVDATQQTLQSHGPLLHNNVFVLRNTSFCWLSNTIKSSRHWSVSSLERNTVSMVAIAILNHDVRSYLDIGFHETRNQKRETEQHIDGLLVSGGLDASQTGIIPGIPPSSVMHCVRAPALTSVVFAALSSSTVRPL